MRRRPAPAAAESDSPVPTGAAASPADDPFELGGYYLARPHPEHGGMVYACRYDAGAGRVRRRSLGTADWAEAKIELATLVLAKPQAAGGVPGPGQVTAIAALDNYLNGHATTIKSEDDAVRAAELAKAYMIDHLKAPLMTVAAWTPARQLDFARWLHASYGHKPTSIERRMDVVCAAFQEMTKVKLRPDPLGQMVECALLTHAPSFPYKRARIAAELQLPPPRPRHSTHALETVGKVLDALDHEHMFRFAILALTTWARPAAIFDFDPTIQIEGNLIDLNPPGRVVTNKRRAKIPMTRTLAFWLRQWKAADAEAHARAVRAGKRPPDGALLTFQGERVVSLKKGLRKRMGEAGVEKFSPGTFRHVMATTVRRLCRQVSREQRSIYLGHAVKEGSRTTDNYEAFDPDYMQDVAMGIDHVMQELQKHTKRQIVSIDDRLTKRERARIGARDDDKTPYLRVV